MILTDDKITEIFCIIDDFCKIFDKIIERHADKILLRKRAIIESVNDELKNIAQVEHSRRRSFDNFFINTLGAVAAYCYFPKKPCVSVCRVFDNQLTLF